MTSTCLTVSANGSPRGIVHAQACAARRAGLQAAGRGRRALEGYTILEDLEEEGARRRSVEHVHARRRMRTMNPVARGIDHLEYAPLPSRWATSAMGLGSVHCSAPDTVHGSVDAVRHKDHRRVASPADGRPNPFRLLMTEPAVASFGCHNIETASSATAIIT